MRSSFANSSLVRLLGEPGSSDAQAPGMDFAERLSLWVGAFDAIGLHATQQAIRAIDAPTLRRRGERLVQADTLDDELRRVRSALASAIAQDLLPLPAIDGDVARQSPHKQRHAELQRHMEQMTSALRDHVRDALGRASTHLRQLAAIDAAMEQVLAAREQALHARLPALVQRRLEREWRDRRAHDAPPHAWPADMVQAWRQALMDEVDMRLAPVAGLIEALRHATNDER